jgi:ketosteroid isomerase-like protein
MSQENVEMARRVVDQLDTGEFDADLFAPDCRIENVETAVTDAVYVGLDGARQWRDDLFGILGVEARLKTEEIKSVGDDCALVVLRLVGQGSASGLPFDLRWDNVLWFRDGRLTLAKGFWDRDAALEAVGLPE